MASLTVLVPVFDEQHLVDDSSRDATPAVLSDFAAERVIAPSPAAARPGASRSARWTC